jgi:hypothetical protein
MEQVKIKFGGIRAGTEVKNELDMFVVRIQPGEKRIAVNLVLNA